MPIQPTAEQIQELVAAHDPGPVVMVNLLRFKPEADGIDAGVTGAEAYARYSVAAEPFLRGVGGRLLSAVRPERTVIGPRQANGTWCCWSSIRRAPSSWRWRPMRSTSRSTRTGRLRSQTPG